PVVGTVADQSTNEDTAKTVTLAETDVDTGDSHTFTATSSTTNVTPSLSGATLTMAPAANWSGTATMTIKANDGIVDSATKTFTLTVSAVNDIPVLASIANQSTGEDNAKVITLSATDVEGSSLTYSATSSASQITIGVSGATLTMTPDNDWSGTSTITAKANDGTAYSIAKTFTLTVSGSNDTPVIGSVSTQTTNEDTAKAVTLSVSDNDSGDSHTYYATSSSSSVTPSISGATLTLTPAANFNGNSTITIKANDGTAYSIAKTFTLTVSAVNDAPVLASISNQSTLEDTAKAVTLSGSDIDGDSMTYSATTSESEITISVSGTTLTMTPDNDWSGTSTITAKANDGTVDSAAKTFTLTVSGSNDAPVVADISNQSTNEDTAKAITLSASDADSDSLTYSATSAESEITISVSSTTLTMTPDANWNGTSTISVTANDGLVDSTAKTFTLTVSAVNDAPTLAAVVHQDTNENVAKVVTLSGADTEGSSLTYSATSSTTNVGISVSGANLTLTPASNWVGTATITAKVNDGTVDSATKSFNIESWNLNTTPLLVLGIGYTNATFGSNAATWAAKIFGTSSGQLNHYMSEISGGRMQFTAAQESSGTANDGIMVANFNKAHPNYQKTMSYNDQYSIMAHFVNSIDYAQYDTNSDGYIASSELQVFFIVAGGESSSGDNTPGGVWGVASCYPPGWVLDGVNFFNCNYGRFLRIGETHFGTHDATIGIMAHELGHSRWHITDLYDTDS
ncbi:MAG: tandem-95 repeat protein, partial [Pseudomonadales bacterium]